MIIMLQLTATDIAAVRLLNALYTARDEMQTMAQPVPDDPELLLQSIQWTVRLRDLDKWILDAEALVQHLQPMMFNQGATTNAR